MESTSRVKLEDDLAGELQDAGREGGGCGDGAEAGGGWAIAAGGEGVVGLVEEVEGLDAEVKRGALGIERELFMEAHVELIEGIEADRVAAGVAVGMVVVRKAEDGIGRLRPLEDRVL